MKINEGGIFEEIDKFYKEHQYEMKKEYCFEES